MKRALIERLRIRTAIEGGLLLLLPLLAYWPAYRAGFIWDDAPLLTENLDVKGGLDGLSNIWCSTRGLDYFPLTSSSFWLEWRLWGPNPLGYHVTNVLLHAVGAVLLWRVLRRLSIPGAWVAALFFAIHPVCVASVAWIAERKNTLSLVFFLLSLLWFLRSESHSQPSALASPPSNGPQPSTLNPPRHWYWLSLLAFLLALLSKTSVVTLPLVLLLCAWWQRGRVTVRDLLRSVPFLVLALALGLVTIWFQTHRAMAGGDGQLPSLLVRTLASGWALWFYLWKTLIPLNLCMVYPQWKIEPASLLAWLPGAIWVAVMVLCWCYRRTWGRAGLFGLGCSCVTLLPVLGMLKMSFHQYSWVADHFQYLALVGPIALAVGGLCLLQRLGTSALQRSIAPGLFLLVSVCSILTWRQAALYQNPATLWRDTLTINPQAWIAFHNLACTLYDENKLEEAVFYYQETLQLKPDYAPAESNLGYALAALGRLDDAFAHCRKAVQIQPSFPAGHNNLGIILSQQGKSEEAIAEFRAALRLDMNCAEAYQNWGAVLARQGNFQDALPLLSSALRLKPGYTTAQTSLALAHYQLGLTLSRDRKTAAALAHWRQALELNPNWPDLLNALAWTLATNPDASLRNGPQAVILAQRACALSGGPGYFDTLAAAYAEAGRFPEAVKAGEKAIALSEVSQTNSIAQLRRRLSLYQSGKPYHGPQ